MGQYKKKKIIIYPFEKERHSLHKDTISLLRKHYDVIYNPKKRRGKITLFFKITRNYCLKWFYHNFIRKFLTFNDVKDLFKQKEISKKLDCDLIYSVAKVPPYENDYIIDFEKITSLADHSYERIDKKFLQEKFSQSNCRAIIPWYDIAKRSLIETIDCTNFMHKIKVIPFSEKSDKIKKGYSKKKITLLFVSSINNPLDFEYKGGVIALEVYSKLIKKYSNLEFVVRAHIPKQVEKKYKSLKGLKLIKDFIPRKQLDQIFVNADILLEPSPGTHLMLECMNFALPVVCFDRWENTEMVIEGKNGFNIDCSQIFGPKKTKEDFQKFIKNFHLNYLKMYKKGVDQKIIEDYLKKTRRLIEDKKLRIKMSKNAKSLVEPGGRYNAEERNKKILKLFKECIK